MLLFGAVIFLILFVNYRKSINFSVLIRKKFAQIEKSFIFVQTLELTLIITNYEQV